MAVVYDYLSGPDFKARLGAIFETFQSMRSALEKEKKAIQKLWIVREKQIERVLTNSVNLHGELQAIIGESLPRIEAMELDSIEDDDQPAALPA
jgi:hypothetical protein